MNALPLRAPSVPEQREAARERVLAVLATVPDPEIPVISVVDLGVIRHVEIADDGSVEVGVAPTYSGCPATPVIKADIIQALGNAGISATATDVLSPPWSSDWLTEEGRQKLLDYGIAPPVRAVTSARALWQAEVDIACPRCRSLATERLSEFGSTPCKALYRCSACLEPFDYFKCL